MNATDRKTLSTVMSRCEALQAECEELAQTLDELVDAYEERYDGMTDTRQDSDAGEALANELTELRAAKDALESYNVSDAVDALGTFSL